MRIGGPSTVSLTDLWSKVSCRSCLKTIEEQTVLGQRWGDVTSDKFRLFFPDGDWFRDEDGKTEFSKSGAESIKRQLQEYVDLVVVPWPRREDSESGNND